MRTAAAANPNCAQRTLQTLATDPDPSTRAALLNNPNLPKAIARSLLNDPSAAVRSRAQTHPVNEFIALEWAAKKTALNHTTPTPHPTALTPRYTNPSTQMIQQFELRQEQQKGDQRARTSTHAAQRRKRRSGAPAASAVYSWKW